MGNTPTQKTNYFGWLAHQLKGWGGPNYGLFFFALGFQLALLVTQPLSAISVVTFFGTMIGVACICLTAGIICWLKYNNQYFWWLAAGLIQVILWGLTAAQGNASIAMLVSSLIYVANDVIAFTYSPWFHKKNRSVEAEAK